jgi:hypothetical protein
VLHRSRWVIGENLSWDDHFPGRITAMLLVNVATGQEALAEIGRTMHWCRGHFFIRGGAGELFATLTRRGEA